MATVHVRIQSTSDEDWCRKVGGVLENQLSTRFGLRTSYAEKPAKGVARIILEEQTGPAGLASADDADAMREEDSYRIRTEHDADRPVYRIIGRSRGLLYGVGRLLREIKRSDGSILWPRLNVKETPAVVLRGIYFPTQTHPPTSTDPQPSCFNAYTAWLWKEGRSNDFENYLVELMLWGMNTVGFWYAEWMDEPWGETAYGRETGGYYRKLFEMARAWRMKTWLVMSTNLVPEHIYNKYPQHQRKLIPEGLWNQFENPNMLCPSAPEVHSYLLEYRRKLIEFFSPDWIELFPTDPGGCDCPTCGKPWWPNYWKLAEEVLGPWTDTIPLRSINFWYFWNRDARNLAARIKDSSIVNTVSTQTAWQEDTAQRFQISDDLARRGTKIIFWPDITMIGGWGAYGTYPFFKGLVDLFNAAPQPYGVLPYSEGRYDDINKFAMLSLAWKHQAAPRKLAKQVLEGMHNQQMPTKAVNAVLAAEQGKLDRARRQLAEAAAQLDSKTTGHYRWCSLDFYTRHAGIVDAASELIASLQQAKETGARPTPQRFAAWEKQLAAIKEQATATARELPKLSRKVNDFNKEHKMFCGTFPRSAETLTSNVGLPTAENLLAELRGNAPGKEQQLSEGQALNLHVSGKRKKKK